MRNRSKLGACLLAICLLAAPMAGTVSAAAPVTQTGGVFDWSQFLGDSGLPGVSDAKAPVSGEDIQEAWRQQTGDNADWTDTPGAPVIAGEYVYCYSSMYIHKYALKTGEEVAKGRVFGEKTNQYVVFLAYGDGKVFIGCDSNNLDDGTTVRGGYLRAYSADTLEPLYVTESFGSGSMASPIAYRDGLLVTGASGAGGVYACIDTRDEDPTKANEVKRFRWKVASETGFYWNGAAFAGDYVVFADGGHLWSVDAQTGEVADTLTFPEGYTGASSVNYYAKNRRVYLSFKHATAGAAVRSYGIGKDGRFDPDGVKEWLSGGSAGASATPVIYNDRLYVTTSAWGDGTAFYVLDANTLTKIYEKAGLNASGSAALTTAYATKDNGQLVYVYMVPNTDTDDLWIFQDREGQTTPVVEVVDGIGEEQYCSQSIAIAADGSLVWYNDAAILYCYRSKADAAYTAADVSAQIARLPAVEAYRFYNRTEVLRLQARYAALPAAEQAKVVDADKLAAILALDATDPVERLNNGLAALDPATVTIDDLDRVTNLEGAYALLDAEQQAAVVGYDKLAQAKTRIAALQEEALVAGLAADIAAMPAKDQLTSADRSKIDALQARLAALDAAAQAKVENRAVLTAAAERVAAIEKQMTDVQALIKAKLEGVTVTLDTRAVVRELDQALEGLPAADIARLTAVEQYLSPAKADIVNLLIERDLYADGRVVTVTRDNAAALRQAVEEIDGFYAGVREADRRYVKHYDAVASVREALAKLNDTPTTVPTEPQETPPTGDQLPLAGMVLALLAVGSLWFAGRRVK